MKRDQLVKGQRRLGALVVACQGLRAQENPGRARRLPVTVKRRLTSKRLLAMLDSGACLEKLLAARKADERGGINNKRVSCMFCILATRNDLEVGAEHNPDLLVHLQQMKERSGQSFQPRFALTSLGANAANNVTRTAPR